MARVNDEGYNLVKLGDTDLTFEGPSRDDVRGREVCSTGREEIGTVEDPYVDEQEREVRYLDVRAGGLLGIGEKHLLIPVSIVREAKGTFLAA